jgi:regulatory protein
MEHKAQRVLEKCMAICSRGEKCISDIQLKLDKWDVQAADSKKIIDKLIAEKFIDEERFVRFFVRDKLRINRWGRIKIAFMLKGKGISQRAVADALAQIEDEEYSRILEDLLIHKKKSIKASKPYELKSKLVRFAQSRGFEYDAISKVLQKIDAGTKD